MPKNPPCSSTGALPRKEPPLELAVLLRPPSPFPPLPRSARTAAAACWGSSSQAAWRDQKQEENKKQKSKKSAPSGPNYSYESPRRRLLTPKFVVVVAREEIALNLLRREDVESTDRLFRKCCMIMYYHEKSWYCHICLSSWKAVVARLRRQTRCCTAPRCQKRARLPRDR